MRLLIHIGAAKCGSTSLQIYLRQNAAALLSSGIFVPDRELAPSTDPEGEQIWLYERASGSPDGPSVIFDRLRSAHHYMEEHGLHTAILSAENLINPQNFASLFSSSPDLFDVTVCLYIRRQDDYFISAFKQWYGKTFPSIQSYIAYQLGVAANWAKLLTPWEAVFSSDRIKVRRFGQEYLVGGDLIADFFAANCLSQDGCRPLEGPANPGFDEHLHDLAHRVRDLFVSEHDNDFYKAMLEIIGPKVLDRPSGSHLLTLSERLDVCRHYAESNASVKSKYFPELPADDPLFAPPTADEVIIVDDLSKLTNEHALLTRAVYGLAKRVAALEEKAG